MSVHYDRARGRWVVRWREAGRQRARRFADRGAARASRRACRRRAVRARGRRAARGARRRPGAASTRTRRRTARAGGSCSGSVRRPHDVATRIQSRGGGAGRPARSPSRRSAAATCARRGDTFGEFWARVLEAKRPYVTAGTLQDYATHGRKRLLPWFGELRLAAIDEDRVRGWLAQMAELVAAGELSAKTVNNARTCLSMTLGEAVRRRPSPQNPCRWVPELPVERTEIDYLRLGEIERYLDACADFYRPLAEFLIGTGARISEALGVRWPDVDLEAGVVRISRQRARGGDGDRADEGQAVPLCAGRAAAGRRRCARSEDARVGRWTDGGWLFLCPPPRPRPLLGPHRAGAAEPQDRARLARVGARGRRPARHAAALAAPHRGDGVARDRPSADLRPAPARASLDHDDRGALRAPRDLVHARGRRADRGADRGGGDRRAA